MATIHSLGVSKLDPGSMPDFSAPIKRIHDGADVTFFLTSLAYKDIMQFILQLNRAVIPRKPSDGKGLQPETWPLTNDESKFSKPVLRVRKLLSTLHALISEVPPDTGPRRFGNVSFRKWHTRVTAHLQSLFEEHMPTSVLAAQPELEAYLMGSFGSPQRLDYGTGHELSFLAFLGCLWKLNYFDQTDPGVEERGIVIGAFEPYLVLIRTLINTYNLEPAGSHGVWGLDDNSFLPYVFGSAQLAPMIAEDDDTPIQGSLTNAPDPALVTNLNAVEREKETSMYFSAIAFIYDVKRGPFWEHSPMLFDISGIKDGWGKINKGMLKMYHAEVLSKFPVVQHFPFGSIFKWEKDPEARDPPPTAHSASQTLRHPLDSHAPSVTRLVGAPSTAAPWASGGNRPAPSPKGFVNGVTRAPWARTMPTPPVLPAVVNARIPNHLEPRLSKMAEEKHEPREFVTDTKPH